MSDRTVTVFGASGRQGQAQVRTLLEAGIHARAVSRDPEIFTTPELRGAEVVAADYADPHRWPTPAPAPRRCSFSRLRPCAPT